MRYDPITPFRRPLDAAHLEQQKDVEVPPEGSIGKWEVLRLLTEARRLHHLTDRDLAVLQALLSFHPEAQLAAGMSLVVYPSNRSICERLNGMPSSTMRRHLQKLLAAGVIARRDSPNGKRFARALEGEKLAFGLDLTPLLARQAEFRAQADGVRANAQRLQRLRLMASLMRRDLAALVDYGIGLSPDEGLWTRLSDLTMLSARALRRKPVQAELEALTEALRGGISEARACLAPPEAEDPGTNDARNGQHIHSSNQDSLKPTPLRSDETASLEPPDRHRESEAAAPEQVPLAMVLERCPELQSFAETPPNNWNDIVGLAEKLRPMMGIAPSVWQMAQEAMGQVQASATLGAMLQRFGEIRSPSGYLRRLAERAAEGRFSVLPMLAALRRPAPCSQL